VGGTPTQRRWPASQSRPRRRWSEISMLFGRVVQGRIRVAQALRGLLGNLGTAQTPSGLFACVGMAQALRRLLRNICMTQALRRLLGRIRRGLCESRRRGEHCNGHGGYSDNLNLQLLACFQAIIGRLEQWDDFIMLTTKSGASQTPCKWKQGLVLAGLGKVPLPQHRYSAPDSRRQPRQMYHNGGCDIAAGLAFRLRCDKKAMPYSTYPQRPTKIGSRATISPPRLL
jgi:hypothetical protein